MISKLFYTAFFSAIISNTHCNVMALHDQDVGLAVTKLPPMPTCLVVCGVASTIDDVCGALASDATMKACCKTEYTAAPADVMLMVSPFELDATMKNWNDICTDKDAKFHMGGEVVYMPQAADGPYYMAAAERPAPPAAPPKCLAECRGFNPSNYVTEVCASLQSEKIMTECCPQYDAVSAPQIAQWGYVCDSVVHGGIVHVGKTPPPMTKSDQKIIMDCLYECIGDKKVDEQIEQPGSNPCDLWDQNTVDCCQKNTGAAGADSIKLFSYYCLLEEKGEPQQPYVVEKPPPFDANKYESTRSVIKAPSVDIEHQKVGALELTPLTDDVDPTEIFRCVLKGDRKNCPVVPTLTPDGPVATIQGVQARVQPAEVAKVDARLVEEGDILTLEMNEFRLGDDNDASFVSSFVTNSGKWATSVEDKVSLIWLDEDGNDLGAVAVRLDNAHNSLREGMVIKNDVDAFKGRRLSHGRPHFLVQREILKVFLPFRVPCIARWVILKIGPWKFRFPLFLWGKRCCKLENGIFSGGWNYDDNANACVTTGTTGPFPTEERCKKMCVEPQEPCVFGDDTEWEHGYEEEDCAGTTCRCNNGVVECDGCRQRYEIHSVADVDSFETKVVDSLKWVSADCGGDCPNWFQDQMEAHLTHGGVAHGNSQFFPWHRAYLKGVEEKMQQYHPCVTMPWWDWSIDRASGAVSGWTTTDDTGPPLPKWGYIDATTTANMGEFVEDNPNGWHVPPGWPDSVRSSNTNINSLPSAATLASWLSRTQFGGSGVGSNFKAFEGPHGSPHVMIGGNMGSFRSPADPIFWLHHAGCDRLWYDWQAINTPNDYDANPALVMPPFTYTPNDVFDSENDLGVCYAASGVVPAHPFPARRRLQEAEEKAKEIIADAESDDGCSTLPPLCDDNTFKPVGEDRRALRLHLIKTEREQATTKALDGFECRRLADPKECGQCTNCVNPTTTAAALCTDSWDLNMHLDRFETLCENQAAELVANGLSVALLEKNLPAARELIAESREAATKAHIKRLKTKIKSVEVGAEKLLNSFDSKQCDEIKGKWHKSTCSQQCNK